MSALRALLVRLRNLGRRPTLEHELEEEFRFHLAMEADRLIAEGVPATEAGRRARLAFGGVEGHREAVRDGWRVPFVETGARDLRRSLRTLVRAPAYSGGVLVTVGFALAAGVAVFTVVEALLLRPLPYPRAQAIHTLWAGFGDGRTFGVTEPEALELPGRIAGVEHVGVWAQRPFNLAGDGVPEQVTGARASAALFDVLGTSPVLGRGYTVAEDTPGLDDVVLLSDRFWLRRFGGDPGAIGRPLQVDGRTRTVLGVMGPEFRFPGPEVDLWVPAAIDPAEPNVFDRYLRAVVRLREGADPATVAEDARRVGTALEEEIPARYGMRNVAGPFNLVPLEETVVGDVRTVLLLLLAGVSLVLLIACANVANLMLARQEARRPELGIRAALGAGRWRLVRLTLLESAVLGVGAGILAALLAWVGVRAFVGLAPPDFPRLAEIDPSPRLLVIAAAAAVLACMSSSLFTSLGPSASRPDRPLTGLARPSTSPVRAQRFRRVLVVAQLALALALLSSSGLLLRSLSALLSEDPGMRADRVLTARLFLPVLDHPREAEVPTFYQRLVETVSEVPGVRAAGVTSTLPMSGGFSSLSYRIDGAPEDPDEEPPTADHQVVTSGYFEALGVQIGAGRIFTSADLRGPLTTIVSEALARQAWPGQDPVGRRIHLGGVNEVGGSEPHIVVGVVRDVLHHGPGVPPRPTVYFPNRALPWGAVVRGMHLVVRAEGDPRAVLPGLRRAIAELDPRLPLARVETMESVFASATARPRLVTALLSAFAVVGLVIAVAGVYGLLAYAVSRRGREIGIRIALGAAPRRVRREILGESLLLAGLGLAAGSMLLLLSSGLVRGHLYGVEPFDPLTVAVSSAVLAAAAVLAGYRPAHRASRIDPGQCLKQE